jgi:hypothetical protein
VILADISALYTTSRYPSGGLYVLAYDLARMLGEERHEPNIIDSKVEVESGLQSLLSFFLILLYLEGCVHRHLNRQMASGIATAD